MDTITLRKGLVQSERRAFPGRGRTFCFLPRHGPQAWAVLRRLLTGT